MLGSPHHGLTKHRKRPHQRHDTWRAGCGESRTSGSEGGPGKPTNRKAGRALRSDPYSKLAGPRKGVYYQLYNIIDIYSRKTVGWRVEERESSLLAVEMIDKAVAAEGADPETLWVHSDRGPSMTSGDVAALYQRLGITRSLSRPHVSNDNPYSESQFKTLKYCLAYPSRFDSVEHARRWCDAFFDHYNHHHHHSALGWHTPASIHDGTAHTIRQQRQVVLDAAYQAHPDRFRRQPPVAPKIPTTAWINPPEKEQIRYKISEKMSQST